MHVHFLMAVVERKKKVSKTSKNVNNRKEDTCIAASFLILASHCTSYNSLVSCTSSTNKRYVCGRKREKVRSTKKKQSFSKNVKIDTV